MFHLIRSDQEPESPYHLTDREPVKNEVAASLCKKGVVVDHYISITRLSNLGWGDDFRPAAGKCLGCLIELFKPTEEHTLRGVAEALHALQKHGLPTTDPVRAVAILIEELGEAAEPALRGTSGDPKERGGLSADHYRQEYRDELAQGIGYGLLLLRALDLGHIRFDRTEQP